MTRRARWLLFATAFIAFAYFNQGGGWNQNSRFSMVRAMVERAQFAIDSYLIYVRADNAGSRLKRIAAHNAEYETGNQANILLWKSKTGQLFPVSKTVDGQLAVVDLAANTVEVQDSRKIAVRLVLSPNTQIKTAGTVLPLDKLAVGQTIRVLCTLRPSGDVEAKEITVLERNTAPNLVYRDLGSVAATGDLAFYRGHFYPNKAPGTAFVAVPGYWLIFQLEKFFGIDPDDCWTLTVNAWLVSVFSVGIISALGVVIFYELAFAFSGGRARLSWLSACAFAFGTMFFPNATLLFEHNIIAVALLGAFYFIYRAKSIAAADPKTSVPFYCLFAGVLVGWAAITNYIAAAVVIFLGAYLAHSIRRRFALLWFVVGLLGPLLLICAYHVACFGTPFTTNYHFQNPDFIEPSGSFLSVFMLPRRDVLLMILFSPFRGLFFTAPILLVTIVALFSWIRDRRLRAEGLLIAGTFVFFVFFNISFNGWDGGDVAVPRYLGPAVPLFSLGVVYGFERFFRTTSVLAALSIALMTLITAVDPQPSTGTGAATVLDKPQWQYNPLWDYELPVFLSRRPLPLLHQQEEQVIHYYDRQLVTQGWPEAERQAELERVRSEIDQKIAAGQPAPLVLARTGTDSDVRYWVGDSDLSIPIGPVSAHSYGYYGGWTDGDFGAIGSTQERWNSFNIGEFFFPESRWSLLPLLIVAGMASCYAVAGDRRLPDR